MPELPEVETIKRGLGKFILNKKIVQVEQRCEKSFIGAIENVEGATVVDLRRRGKALLIDLDNGYTMMVHLRMTGQLIWRGSFSERTSSLKTALLPHRTMEYGSVRGSSLPRISSPITSPTTENASEFDASKEQFAAGHPSKNFMDELPNQQTRVIFVFNDGTLYFNDQRKFGFVKVLKTEAVEQEKFIAELGKEPWEMPVEEFYKICMQHKNALIKAVLLDQKLIAGLGNIYADESLFYAHVHPERRAGTLTETEVAKLLEGACKVMDASIDSGGSTMATYIRPDGTTGDYLEKFAQVFRREGQPCNRCGTEIIKLRVAGRGTHICPKCQEKK